jgi:glutamate synthase (NADPH/NADH) large chain
MSGGIAYVYDPDSNLPGCCNTGLVDLKPLHEKSIPELRGMLENHLKYTKSSVAQRLLDNWEESLGHFVRVMPRDFARVLQERQVNVEEEVSNVFG